MNEPKEPLFHYTSIQGLIGILTDRKIWATNISHLNDKQELFEARDMFREAIDTLQKSIDSSPEPAIRPPDYRKNPKIKFIGLVYDFLDLARELSIFVCSFSREGNQLSQWRGYCPNAYGFSIGFDYVKLKLQAKKQKFFLRECVYQKKEQRKIVDDYVQTKIVPSLSNLGSDAEMAKMALKAFSEILEILPTIKNGHFAEEKEWRLISSAFDPPSTIKFRPGKTAIIPYCEFQLAEEGEDLPVECIKIGPTPNKDESLLSLKTLLRKEKMLEWAKVNHSDIPYREI